MRFLVTISGLGLGALLCSAQDVAQSWDALPAKVSSGERVTVFPLKGSPVTGRWRNVTADALTIESRRKELTVPKTDIARVTVQRKGSRWRSTGWGALTGFGIGFVIGMASAQNLLDRNNPSAALRAGTGAGIGMFGAGIGAGIGAGVGGSRHVTVYRNR